LGRDDGRREHQPFKRAQTDPIRESDKIKLPKEITFTLVNTITKTVCKKWVTSKALSFLNQ
jgi:hypothetical protein